MDRDRALPGSNNYSQDNKLPILKDGIVTLEPFDGPKDFDYLYDLRKHYKYNKVSDEDARQCVPYYGRYFWKGSTKSIMYGVTWISWIPIFGGWMLDAYRDERLVRSLVKDDYTYRAGKLVLDYFFKEIGNEIATAHDARSRAATFMLKRLGFEIDGYMMTQFGKMVTLKLRRARWEILAQQ